ncbi:MAG: AAA family ATPase [bacterium]|nr:AAA family ATPase [bacterium]
MISIYPNAKVLIIDEISMFHSYRLDMVNQVCKTLRQNGVSFGGLQVILCGDFFQLPPVPDANHEKSCFAYKSQSWEELDLKICYLDEQHRQLDEFFRDYSVKTLYPQC